MNQWLLEESVFEILQTAIKAGGAPSAEQVADFEAIDRSGSSILSVVGDQAQVKISGVLTQQPNFLAMLFGGGNTTYNQINAAIADAEQDPNVAKVEFAIDSPGGTIAGLFETLEIIKAMTKPTQAIVHNMAASAAYAIASQTDEIVAANVSSRVGSIGIVAVVSIQEDKVTISSTKAPLKAPDVRTEEGRAAVRRGLDTLHDIFVDVVANGRNMSVDAVNADFGRGAMVLAEEALERGMIDGVAGVNQEASTNDGGSQKTEAVKMDLEKLKAEHPGVYAQAVKVGVDLGVKQEHDRVSAHLIRGEASGDMETASKAIQDGLEMTEALRATYDTAATNRRDLKARQDDDVDAEAGDKTGTAPTASDEESLQVASLVEAGLGMEVK